MNDHGYKVFDDRYCYKGTFVLKRRLGHPLNFTKIRPRGFLAAMIKSFGDELGPLESELRDRL